MPITPQPSDATPPKTGLPETPPEGPDAQMEDDEVARWKEVALALLAAVLAVIAIIERARMAALLNLHGWPSWIVPAAIAAAAAHVAVRMLRRAPVPAASTAVMVAGGGWAAVAEWLS